MPRSEPADMSSRSHLFFLCVISFVSLYFSQSTQASEGQPAKKSSPDAQKKRANKPPVPQVGIVDEKLISAMRWRQVGPFRGGRVLAVTGVQGEPNVFYFGGASGGVWKTTDAGAPWTPLFDKQPIASIGAIAVAPSDHNVIYAGSGEACIRGNISYGHGVTTSLGAATKPINPVPEQTP